ncbi:hypothetical protein STEG23_001021 [Scotinomys teguina]
MVEADTTSGGPYGEPPFQGAQNFLQSGWCTDSNYVINALNILECAGPISESSSDQQDPIWVPERLVRRINGQLPMESNLPDAVSDVDERNQDAVADAPARNMC